MNSEQLSSEIRTLVSELHQQVSSPDNGVQPAKIEAALRSAALLHEKLSVLKHLAAEGDVVPAVPPPPAQEATPTPEVQQPADKPATKKHATLDLFGEHESVLADSYVQGKRSSVAEQMAGKPQPSSVGTQLREKPVTDLKAAIGINERFRFINGLFGGDMHEYNESIACLNAFSGLKEAKEYIEKLRVKHEWEDKSVASEFIGLVERRFRAR